jgi:cytochrome c-type biogenesis protein CcmH/NrfF
VLQALKRTIYLLPFMVEPTLEIEKVMPASMKAKEEQENQVPFLEHEIECPRCHDSMMLCSDFDNLYYVCEGCDFCLYTIKKSAL